MVEKARNSTVDFCYATRSDSITIIEIARSSLNDSFEKCSNNSSGYETCYIQIRKTLNRKIDEKYGGEWFIWVAGNNHDCYKPDSDYTGRTYFSLGEFKFSFEQDKDAGDPMPYMGKVETIKSLSE